MMHARTRLISLRMTDEEYDKLREACAGGGARSVSEFARNLLLNPPRPHFSHDHAAHLDCHALSAFDSRLTTVEQEVAEVRQQLQQHLDAPPDAPATDFKENE